MGRNDGIWLDEHTYYNFSTGSTSKGVQGSRQRVHGGLHRALIRYMSSLPNPDVVLKKLGKSQAEAFGPVRADAHVISCIQSRKSGVLKKEFGLEQKIDGEDTVEKRFVESILTDKLDMYSIISMILEAPYWGTQFLEIMWRPEGGRDVPMALLDRSLQHFTWSVAHNQPLLRTQEHPEGELLWPQKWIVAQHNPSYDNPGGDALLSSCYWPVVIKKDAVRFMLRFADKWGMPYLIGKYDPDMIDAGSEDGAAEIDEIFDALAALAQDGVSVVPNDVEVALLEAAKSSSADLYVGLINFCNAEISKALLSHTASTEATPGKLGTDATALMVREDVIARDMRMVERAINELIEYICEKNFTSNVRPWFTYIEEESFNTERANRDKIVVEIAAQGGQTLTFTDTYYKRHYNYKDDEIQLVQKPTTPAPGMPFSEKGCGHSYTGGPSTAHEHAITTAADEIAGSERTEAAMLAMMKPVIAMIQSGASYGEVILKLPEVYGEMDTTEMLEIIENATFAANALGRVSAQQEDGDHSDKWQRAEQMLTYAEWVRDLSLHFRMPAAPPLPPADFNSLLSMSAAELKKAGLGNWDGKLKLFPASWYENIPIGFPIVDIFGKQDQFVPGQTDNDHRFGFLAYGVMPK